MRPLPLKANFMLHAIVITAIAMVLSGYQSISLTDLQQFLSRSSILVQVKSQQ
jgi:hypothetical protein